MEEIAYLATPYTYDASSLLEICERVERVRFEIVTEVSILLFRQGIINLSPITQSHVQKTIASRMNIELGSSWSFWKKADLLMLSVCSALYVLRIHGWKYSVGIQGEVKEANRLGLPIYFIDYDRARQTITITREE